MARRLPIILAIIALLLSALYVVGLVFDWPGWLRGSNWVWARRVPEVTWRFLLMPAALIVGLAVAGWAGRDGAWSRRRTWLLLAAVVVLTPMLQLAIAAQHRAQPLSAAVLGASGFWQEGARIDDPLAFARRHAAQMPSYADVHVRTQPPGWPLAYWATGELLVRAPGLADPLGRWLHRYDCLSPEMAGMATAHLSAGWLRAAVLLLSGLGALPLYAIGRRCFAPGAARLAVVAYAYLPALLVFAGRFDVAFALLALVAVWLALRALDGREPARGRRAAGVALPALIALGSFFTFTALAIGGVAWLIGAAVVWAEGERGWLRRALWLGGGMAAAVLVFWLALAAVGIDGLTMWRVGQAIHREYRLNYPAFFVFNLYDLAVFMGIVGFAGVVGMISHRVLVIRGETGRRGSLDQTDLKGATTRGSGLAGGPTTTGMGLALGWVAAVLLLNLSATVRAETGRLWLFLMPLGLLVGWAWWWGVAWREGGAEAGRDNSAATPFVKSGFVGQLAQPQRTAGRGSSHPSSLLLHPSVLFAAYLIQALATGYFLGGRAAEPMIPPPTWQLPETATPLAYELGDAVALRGYELSPTAEGARLVLYWQARGFPGVELPAFVHALRHGEVVGQADGPPSAVPMWCWVPGEIVADERLLVAPGGVEGVGVGLYDPVSGARQPVSPPVTDDRIVLPGPE